MVKAAMGGSNAEQRGDKKLRSGGGGRSMLQIGLRSLGGKKK